MKLFLIRHPQPQVAKGSCYGVTDVAILPNWQAQGAQIKNWLARHLQGAVCYQHSPLSRAPLLANYLNAQSTSDERLQELNFGHWEGLLWQDIDKASIDDWCEDIVNNTPYGGESLGQMSHRVQSWWQSLDHDAWDNVVITTHSGVIKVLVSLLCGWPLQQAHTINVGFCSITELTITGDYVSLHRLGAGDWVTL